MTRSWVPNVSSEVSIVRMDSEPVREIFTLKSLVYLRLMLRTFDIGFSGSAKIWGTVIVFVFYPSSKIHWFPRDYSWSKQCREQIRCIRTVWRCGQLDELNLWPSEGIFPRGYTRPLFHTSRVYHHFKDVNQQGSCWDQWYQGMDSLDRAYFCHIFCVIPYV